MAQSTLQQLIGQLGDFWEWAQDALSDKQARRAVVADLGGDPSAAEKEVTFPPAGLASVNKYRDAAEPDREALISAVTDIRKMIEALRPLVEAIRAGEGYMALDEATRALLDLLAMNYVRLRYPRLYFIMQALNFGEEATSVYGNGQNAYGRFWSAIKKLFGFVFSPRSAWNDIDLDNGTDARQLSDYFLMLTAIVLAVGNRREVDDFMYGWDVIPRDGDGGPSVVERVLARMLTVKLAEKDESEEVVLDRSITASVAFVPKTEKEEKEIKEGEIIKGGKGIFLALGGGYEVDAEISKLWSVIFKLDTKSAVSLLLRQGEDKFQFSAPGDSTGFEAALAFEGKPERDSHGRVNKHSIDLSIKGTGLHFGLVRFEATLNNKAAQLKATFRESDFAIAPNTFDGFLGKLLPSDGLRVPFDFAVGLASDRGFFLEGQLPFSNITKPALAQRLPNATLPPLPPLPVADDASPGVTIRFPNVTSLGPLTIQDFELGISTDGEGDDRAYVVGANSTLSAKLGPVFVRVEQIGVVLALKFPERMTDANLGLFDFSIGPRLPRGIAVAIDAKGIVTGGGFLRFDPDRTQIAGALELTIKSIGVKAIGVLSTRMPDGSPGWSLLLLIYSQFPQFNCHGVSPSMG